MYRLSVRLAAENPLDAFRPGPSHDVSRAVHEPVS